MKELATLFACWLAFDLKYRILIVPWRSYRSQPKLGTQRLYICHSGVNPLHGSLRAMLPSSPPAPPFPFVGITVLVLLYLVIFYLVSQDDDLNEDESSIRTGKEENYSGLSIEEIQQLPWFNCHVNTTAICGVCLDGFQVGERCRIDPVCSHIFHKHCIDLWLVRRPTCPNCRSPFKPKETVDIV
ncbi:E3 ubiquitin-protein ligase ATL59-like [Durio zibethinus]|uniref:RING-type E3 ubiquitin transferase n=1 Tax=Durio zibethinus TaxID=66656 RepID=A0A6P6B5I3_DURZI|nr:E3 ubiquitin-protein ligase ATL59-like [Durio zibethinus]